MGGQQSIPVHSNGHSTSNGGGTNHNHRNDEDSLENKCQPCFWFSPSGAGKLKNLVFAPPQPPSSSTHSGNDRDLMGSPLPDTPIFERKRREATQQRILDDPSVIFSSRYGGLEKEVSGTGLNLFLAPSGNKNKINGGGPSSRNGAGTRTTLDNNNNNNSGVGDNDTEGASVYEGPDAEEKLLERYNLLEVLGVGSTSTVHRCVDKQTREQFACKVIDCQLIEERFQGMMTQFQTEIEALRKLQHPGIIRLLDVFIKTEDKIFIIMELMEGGELFDYVVQKGTLTEDEAAQIVRMVTSALVYMHSRNVCHRDLKPENLLLKTKPRPSDHGSMIEVKVIDFGLSKAMEEQPVARTFLGTRGYLAPEMLQRRDYTRAVDTWALGVIVFVLLCGCLPFDDDSALVPSDDLVKAKFVLRFPRWAKNLSASAKNLLSHLLDVNPRTRYTAEQALAHPWVRGETAPKGNLLASPGRIKKSPALVGKKTTPSSNGRYGKTAANAGRNHNMTPPTPSGPMKRKGSI